MSRTSILSDDSTIHNFISKLHLPLYFSRPFNWHIADFIKGATQKGYCGKTQVLWSSALLPSRNTLGHFLAKGCWDESYLWKTMKSQVLQAINKADIPDDEPIFPIYDDSITKKTNPSSQATHPI